MWVGIPLESRQTKGATAISIKICCYMRSLVFASFSNFVYFNKNPVSLYMRLYIYTFCINFIILFVLSGILEQTATFYLKKMENMQICKDRRLVMSVRVDAVKPKKHSNTN